MANVLIYSKPTCPYCIKAKALLKAKGAVYEDVDILAQPERREEMIAQANGRTSVPQIFINGQHIGGCDDLHALEDAGKLDKILSS